MTFPLIASNGLKKNTRGLELPDELSERVWLHEDGVLTIRGRRWEFRENRIYQIQQDSEKLLLVFLRDEGIQHVFRSYRANWLTSFTDSQLIRREVLKMTKGLKPCPHCGGMELKIELEQDSPDVGVLFTGRVLCLGNGCGSVTSWHVGVSREALKKAAMTVSPKNGKAPARGEAGYKSLTPEEEKALAEKLAMDFLIAAWNERTGIRTNRR